MRIRSSVNPFRHTTLAACIAAVGLLGCEPSTGGSDADSVTPDAAVAADAVPDDSAAPVDTAAPADTVVAEVDAVPTAECTAAASTACDDKDPCTTDSCVNEKCTHAPVTTGQCDDGDPCTVEDACGANGCTGKKKDCDDKESCTKDACELNGKCSHTHNMHEDCLPLIQLDSPPRGLRLGGATASVLVKGVILPTATTPTTLTIQGLPVPMAKDGSFSVQVPLQPGAQALVVSAVDQLGGEKLRVQGIHYAPQWTAPGMPVAAGAVNIGSAAILAGKGAPQQAWQAAYDGQLKGAAFSVLPAYGVEKVLVNLGIATGVPAAGAGWAANTLVLTGNPAPAGVLLPWPATGVQDLGVPVSSECGNSAGGGAFQDGFSGVQHLVSRDLINAALRAAWLGGAWSGDISKVSAVLPKNPYTAVITARPWMPWLVQGCTAAKAGLALVDLEIAVQAFAKDTGKYTATVTLHVAILAAPEFKVVDGKLQLWLGESSQIQADAVTDTLKSTDAHVLFANAAVLLAVPALLAEWAKAPLVEVQLPAGVDVGGVKVGWSQAGGPAVGAAGLSWGAAVK